MKGKYVIFESAEFGLEYPVLLPGENHFINHKDITIWRNKPVSAGFFSISPDKISIWGESISLKLKSRPEDATIITNYLTK